MGAPHTRFWGYWTWLHPKLGLHGNSRLASTLGIQFLRNLAKTHTNRDATSRPGPQSLQAPPPLNTAPPAELSRSVAAPQPENWSLKPRLLHRFRPGSDKTPPPGRQAPPSFLPCGVIQSGDWVCGARPRPDSCQYTCHSATCPGVRAEPQVSHNPHPHFHFCLSSTPCQSIFMLIPGPL